MSKFSFKKTETIEFDGDKVTAEIELLSRAELFAVNPYLMLAARFASAAETSDEAAAQAAASVTPEEFERIQSKAFDILLGKVTISGLTTEDGAALALPDIVNVVYFSELVGVLFGLMVKVSRPCEKEAAELKKPHGKGLRESDTKGEELQESPLKVG